MDFLSIGSALESGWLEEKVDRTRKIKILKDARYAIADEKGVKRFLAEADKVFFFIQENISKESGNKKDTEEKNSFVFIYSYRNR